MGRGMRARASRHRSAQVDSSVTGRPGAGPEFGRPRRAVPLDDVCGRASVVPTDMWTCEREWMSPKMGKFIAEYLVDGNATAAAVRAGYSARSAKHLGARLLTRPDVQARLRAAGDKYLAK